MISAQTIRDRLATRPFVPFRIITSAGTTTDVFHPEQVIVAKQTIGVAVAKTADQKAFDHIITRGILHLVGLEDLPIPSVANTNANDISSH
jgi:hypothetical protein